MIHLHELYGSRTVLHSLIYNNLFGRYRNSALGFAWNFVIPLMMICVYYVVFTEIRRSEIPDFIVYVLSAMFPFTFMTQNLTAGAPAVTGNSGMVKMPDLIYSGSRKVAKKTITTTPVRL